MVKKALNSATGQAKARVKASRRPDSGQKQDNAPKSNVAMISRDISTIIGLDLSTTASGWAVLNNEMKLLDYGVIVPDRSANLFERIRFIRDGITKKLILFSPTFCAIEDMIGVRNGRVTKILNYLNGVVAMSCYEYNGNDVLFIASSSLKKAINVNPRALKKEGMNRDQIKQVCFDNVSRIFNIKLRDEVEEKYKFDIADAIICAFKLYQNLGAVK